MNVKQKKAVVCSFLLSGILLLGSVVYADNNGGININITNNPNISNETNVESNNTNTNTSTNENNNTNNNENNNTNNNENNNDNQNSNTNTNTNTNENDNGPNKPKPKPKPNKNIDGSATITYLGSYQVKVSGWTNTDRVSVTIGSTTYQISVTNPKNERKDFTDTHTLPTSYNGTYQASIYAFNAKNSQRKKQIGSGRITITKPIPAINGQATVTDQGNGKAKISGWTNTDRVKITVGTSTYQLTVTNPNHEKKTFTDLRPAPSSSPGTYAVNVIAYNAGNTATTKNIGSGSITIPKPIPAIDGQATVTDQGDGKAKISGWTNTDRVKITVGASTYQLTVTNPNHEKKPFTDLRSAPSTAPGTYPVTVNAYNAVNTGTIKKIGSGNVTIPVPIPSPDGQATLTYLGDYRVRIYGWTNTDRVKVNIATENYEITVNNPNHTRQDFNKEYTLPSSFVGDYTGYVYAYNYDKPSEAKKIGENGFNIPKPYVPHSPTGELTGATGIDVKKINVQGWARDEDAPNTPLRVHIYVGGNSGSGAESYEITTDANGNFNTNLDVARTGTQQVYAYAIDNDGKAANTEIGHREVVIAEPYVPHSPKGAFERYETAEGTIRVQNQEGTILDANQCPGDKIYIKGWAKDEDVPNSAVRIRIEIDGEHGKTTKEIMTNSDGTFGQWVDLSNNQTGWQQVSLYAVDNDGGANDTYLNTTGRIYIPWNGRATLRYDVYRTGSIGTAIGDEVGIPGGRHTGTEKVYVGDEVKVIHESEGYYLIRYYSNTQGLWKDRWILANGGGIVHR